MHKKDKGVGLRGHRSWLAKECDCDVIGMATVPHAPFSMMSCVNMQLHAQLSLRDNTSSVGGQECFCLFVCLFVFVCFLCVCLLIPPQCILRQIGGNPVVNNMF